MLYIYIHIYESSTLAKSYGMIKVWCYWEHIREQIGNLRSLWELDENQLGTERKTAKWSQGGR